MTGSTAVLDANVLYPAPLRDFLLQLAFDGLFHPKWSIEIQNEWTRNVLLNRPDISPEKLVRTTLLMNRAFPNANVSGYESIVPTVTNHPKDAHVLAAAIHAKANVIVTFNLRDFIIAESDGLFVPAIHPDDFTVQLLAENPVDFRNAIKDLHLRLNRPKPSMDDYMDTIEKCGLIKTTRAFRLALQNR